MSFPLDSLSVTFPVLQVQLGECPGTVSLVFHHPHFFSHTGNGVRILGPLKIKTTSLVLVIFQRRYYFHATPQNSPPFPCTLSVVSCPLPMNPTTADFADFGKGQDLEV